MSSVLPEVFVPIHSLVPLKPDVPRIHILKILAGVDLDEFPPVKGVLINDDPANPLHLLVDGHHRSFTAYRRGRNIIKAHIASEDWHLPHLGATAIADCLTIEAVRRRYEREWQPHTRALGVTGIEHVMYFGNLLPAFQ
jgi:hypothetical protein